MAVAVAMAVAVSGGGAVAVAGLTKRFFHHIQKDFVINVWGCGDFSPCQQFKDDNNNFLVIDQSSLQVRCSMIGMQHDYQASHAIYQACHAGMSHDYQAQMLLLLL